MAIRVAQRPLAPERFSGPRCENWNTTETHLKAHLKRTFCNNHQGYLYHVVNIIEGSFHRLCVGGGGPMAICETLLLDLWPQKGSAATAHMKQQSA